MISFDYFQKTAIYIVKSEAKPAVMTKNVEQGNNIHMSNGAQQANFPHYCFKDL